MKKILVSALFLFASLLNTVACIQESTSQLQDGTVISMDMSDGIIPKGHRLVNSSDIVLKHLDSLWKATNDINYLSDYGVVLIFHKKYEEAKDVYLNIEKIKPNQYTTAANLGTVYELLGDNAEALKWIKKSVQINAASHDSSEWLHVKILEAKIKGDKFITSDFLLNTNFGTDSMPASSLKPAELIRLRKALFYQLNERVTFIHPQDKIVAELLFDLANVALLTGAHIYDVNDVYSMAKKYGYADPLWEKRSIYTKHLSLKINKNQGTISQNTGEAVVPPSETNYAAIITLGVCLLIFPVFAFLYLKKRLENNKEQ